MRLIPNKHQLKWLSAEDQAFWRGYFEGVEDTRRAANRKRNPMTFNEIVTAAMEFPYGSREQKDFLKEELTIRRRYLNQN